eukprot:641636-Pelagomonas_calceolata.AAC.7
MPCMHARMQVHAKACKAMPPFQPKNPCETHVGFIRKPARPGRPSSLGCWPQHGAAGVPSQGGSRSRSERQQCRGSRYCC